MTEDRPAPPRHKPPRTGKTAERQAREADALRANLARRKTHQRARQAAQADAADQTESPTVTDPKNHGADT